MMMCWMTENEQARFNFSTNSSPLKSKILFCLLFMEDESPLPLGADLLVLLYAFIRGDFVSCENIIIEAENFLDNTDTGICK